MSIFKCPHCEEPIEHLSYELPVVEYGTFYFEEDSDPCSGNHDCDGTDGVGSSKYWCPECEGTIEDLSELTPYKEEDDEEEEEVGLTEEEQEERKTRVITPDGRFCANISNSILAIAQQHIKCPDCGTIVLLDDDDKNEDLECTKCGKILSN